jgi:hypothetical protein
VSAPLTPASMIATLSGIGQKLEDKSDEVADLDLAYVQLKGAYKSAYARAFLNATGSNDVRKYIAETETEGLALEAELAEQVLRAARESLRVLRDRLEIGRSLGALLRTEWNA